MNNKECKEYEDKIKEVRKKLKENNNSRYIRSDAILSTKRQLNDDDKKFFDENNKLDIDLLNQLMTLSEEAKKKGCKIDIN